MEVAWWGREMFKRRRSMEIVADWLCRTPEANTMGLMMYGFIQLVACLWISRFMKRPEK